MDRLKILVIDDDPVFLGIMAGILGQDASVACTCHVDPVAAIAAIRQDAPDLLFLDMNMPAMTGVRLLARLADLRYAGKVVLISGYEKRILEAVRDFAGSLGLGVAGLLNKPVDKDAIFAAVVRARAHSDARRYGSNYTIHAEIGGKEVLEQLDADHVCVAYQPRYRMLDGRIRGIEALARWKMPDHLALPGSFVPAVYSEGLITPFSLLVFDRLVRDLRVLHNAGHQLSGSINLSVLSLADDTFVNALTEIAARHRIDLRFIIIEISEKQMFGNIKNYLDNLLALIFHGCRIAIDNFGGGYFALSLLKQIPFAEMKIDRSFVSGAWQDTRSSIIFRNSVRLGLDFGMQVVGVGGETAEDLNFCRELGCDYFQGFHKSRPLLLGDLQRLLASEATTR